MKTTVAALCSRVTSGGTPNRAHPEYYEPGTIPWVKTGDLLDGPVSRYDEHISKEGLASSSAKLLPEGTVLMAMYGATVGRLGWLTEEAACNQAACAMIANPAVCDYRWLFYALMWSRSGLVGLASGAAQQNLNAGLIKSMELPATLLAEQRAIAEVLGALDDKIAANDRVGNLCLELADSMFTEAVRGMRLGGQTFGDLAEVAGGGTPKTSFEEYWNGSIPWATPTDVTALNGPYLFTTSRMITEDGLAACSSKLYPKQSILMTSRATIGAFAIAQVPVAVNQGFIVVNAKNPIHQFWLFHEMRSRVSEFISHANGATFLELSRGKFKQFQVRIPDPDLARSFSRQVVPLHEQAAQTMTETATLVATRDELLPLLMSGKVRVREAEKIVEEVV
ncbi:restriction endonuclease subunit S [Phytoactinopolyspora alkaliphila]|uniref:Restriction endonuclease subunit S n=1 Tax=Phytoactinopolyspora alkaliphila TaxID=1783498 RepID=A0A6N9YIA5_9ACTN|nr:restriction endonuclease subunit S [Phytoactinopolyspora alkaliphila]NED94781.1 restriction endonuclease subunit S [Phytoactinopolyspora alkaliphila]